MIPINSSLYMSKEMSSNALTSIEVFSSYFRLTFLRLRIGSMLLFLVSSVSSVSFASSLSFESSLSFASSLSAISLSFWLLLIFSISFTNSSIVRISYLPNLPHLYNSYDNSIICGISNFNFLICSTLLKTSLGVPCNAILPSSITTTFLAIIASFI